MPLPRCSRCPSPPQCSPPPVVSPGALSLPPYPPLTGLGQTGMERLPYPVVPSSLLQHSMMYMAHYMPQVGVPLLSLITLTPSPRSHALPAQLSSPP